MNLSVKESIELAEQMIFANLERWQKQAKPFYSETKFEEVFGQRGLVVTLPDYFKKVEMPMNGKSILKGIDTSLKILEFAEKGDIDEARKIYNTYGRFDERMSYLEGYISNSLYVPEFIDCLERDWILFIKHFPWQAEESMVELQSLLENAQAVLNARDEKGDPAVRLYK